MLKAFLSVFLYVLTILHPPARFLIRPQQVRIAWTEHEQEIAVRWTTWLPAFQSSLQYTISRCDGNASQPPVWKEVNPAFEVFRKHIKYDIFLEMLYTAVIRNVSSDCVYSYQVGGGHLWSRPFSFKGLTPYYNQPFSEEDLYREVKLGIFGDMGIGNFSSWTRSYLRDFSRADLFHGIVHLGDIAYDMDRHLGATSDEFFREIEDIAGYTPYMVVPGNHEHRQNFSHYSHLFRMPVNDENQGTNLFYSMNMGRGHFVFINAEAYFYMTDASVITQYNWLVHDLEQANLHRDLIPWLVIFSHKPLYCQIDWRRPMEESKDFKCNYDCDHECALLRGELEDLFYLQGVDFVFAGHMHNYERECPIYQNVTVKSEVDENHFHLNPKAQISILSGTAGSDHVLDK